MGRRLIIFFKTTYLRPRGLGPVVLAPNAGEGGLDVQSQKSEPSNTEFLEENLVPHLGILQNLVPTNDLDLEVNISQPLEPAQAIGHRLEIFFALKPRFDLGRQVADDIPVERGVFGDKHLSALRCRIFPIADIVDVAHDLLDGVFI